MLGWGSGSKASDNTGHLDHSPLYSMVAIVALCYICYTKLYRRLIFIVYFSLTFEHVHI